MNENKKLLFDVYEVSFTNSEVKKAIENNGNVKVEFFKEKTYRHYPGDVTINYPVYPNITINPYPVYPTYPHNPFWYGGTGSPVYRCSASLTGSASSYSTPASSTTLSATGNVNCCTTTSNATLGFGGTITNTGGINCGENTINFTRSNRKLYSDKIEETGRVDKGGNSDQTFRETEFISESSPMTTIEYKLLPVSKKPLNSKEVNEGKKYCTNCGAKVSKRDKFCSSCGSKL